MTMLDATKAFIEWMFFSEAIIPPCDARLLLLISNTNFCNIILFFVHFTLCIFTSILWGSFNEIRQFKALPADQVGLFTLNGTTYRAFTTWFSFCVTCILGYIYYECATKGINITGIADDTKYLLLGPLYIIVFSCTTIKVIYILYNGRYVYKEIALRTSILYTIQRHPYITFHNARHFCEQFSLRVFPVKIFERLHYENPDTTLFDLEKVVMKAQRHVTFMKELGDTNSHLRYIEPVVPSSQ